MVWRRTVHERCTSVRHLGRFDLVSGIAVGYLNLVARVSISGTPCYLCAIFLNAQLLNLSLYCPLLLNASLRACVFGRATTALQCRKSGRV